MAGPSKKGSFLIISRLFAQWFSELVLSPKVMAFTGQTAAHAVVVAPSARRSEHKSHFTACRPSGSKPIAPYGQAVTHSPHPTQASSFTVTTPVSLFFETEAHGASANTGGALTVLACKRENLRLDYCSNFL